MRTRLTVTSYVHFLSLLLSLCLPPPSPRSEKESKRILRCNWAIVEKGVGKLCSDKRGNLCYSRESAMMNKLKQLKWTGHATRIVQL